MSESRALELYTLTLKRKEIIQELHKQNDSFRKAIEPINTRLELVEKELTQLVNSL